MLRAMRTIALSRTVENVFFFFDADAEEKAKGRFGCEKREGNQLSRAI